MAELTGIELAELAKSKFKGGIDELELYFETVRQFLPDIISKKPYFEDIYNKAIEYKIKNATTDVDTALKFSDIAKKTALVLAPDYFHYYLLYVEWNRVPAKKFYPPRMRALKVVVDDLQDLADGVIKILTVSLPVRVGKSTLGIFYLTWLMGKYPDMANLMSGHSDTLTKGFYKEVLSILLDEEYLWGDVFPNTKIAATSAEDESICLNKQRRFPTLTCRAIEGTLTGAVEVAKLLYVDDIIKDLEEALSPQRLQNKYNAYLNQLKDRKKDGAMELHIGTRWAVTDVIGKLKEQYKDDPTVRFRVVPAVNENGESNFDYPYNLGFSTAYYEDMKASIDPAEWNSKYMGDPQPREGLLFPQAELNFYNGILPDGEPDVTTVCDVAFGGGDSLSSPIIYWYGDVGYVHDWVFNRGAKNITQPLVVAAYHRHGIIKARFEANAGGDVYADNIREQLREIGDRPYIYSKRADTKMGKMARIQRDAPDIKKMLYFRSDKKRGKEYEAAMNELMRYTITASKQHDDAPDSLSMAIDEHLNGISELMVVDRPC